nr:Flp pilus assembly protein CpaB [Mesobacillus harenae]
MLALIMGAITTVLFFQYMKSYDAAETVTAESTIGVVIAKEQISKNERIPAEKLEMQQLPEKSVHTGTAKTIDEAAGMIATADIIEGEPVMLHRLVSEKSETIFVSRKVREGFRAVSVGVNFTQSVSNLIEPEDEVDVIFTKLKKDEKNETAASSVILLEKVRVLAVGRKLIAPEDKEELYAEYSSVTLELTPGDSVKLVNSSQEGSIHFILQQRPPAESSTAEMQSEQEAAL